MTDHAGAHQGPAESARSQLHRAELSGSHRRWRFRFKTGPLSDAVHALSVWRQRCMALVIGMSLGSASKGLNAAAWDAIVTREDLSRQVDMLNE